MQFSTREGRGWSVRSGLVVTLGLTLTLGACKDTSAPLRPSDTPLSSPNLPVTTGKQLIPNQYIVVFKNDAVAPAGRPVTDRLTEQLLLLPFMWTATLYVAFPPGAILVGDCGPIVGAVPSTFPSVNTV